jgi:hypothetical protein
MTAEQLAEFFCRRLCSECVEDGECESTCKRDVPFFDDLVDAAREAQGSAQRLLNTGAATGYGRVHDAAAAIARHPKEQP